PSRGGVGASERGSEGPHRPAGKFLRSSGEGPAGTGRGGGGRRSPLVSSALGEDQRERASMNGNANAGEVVSTRVLTVPNLISFARLCLVPVFLGIYLAGRYVPALVILFVVGTSD